MYDSIYLFRETMLNQGLTPPDIIEPGKMYRFPGIGKCQNNTAGWCKLFNDCLGGCFGDWSSGLSEIWFANQNKGYTPAERLAFKKHIKDVQSHTKKERQARQATSANKATRIWNYSSPAPYDHPYLISKCINTHNARLYKESLVLPILNFSNEITSLQFIKPDGQKLLLSGGKKQGCFIPISNHINTIHRVIICEGWATACTLSEDEQESHVLAAIDAGNLKSVAIASRIKWPTSELIIAGDDDRLKKGNPGLTKASSAAIAANALLALPQWPTNAPKSLTDFNDLAIWLKRDML